MESTPIKNEFIQDYGEAYVTFGLPRLMGRIVGLLLCKGEPISLDQIAEELGMSKGPVSQIMRRLRDHNLIQRVWVHGDRKDYYEALPDIFGTAFRNHMKHMHSNLLLAEKYKRKIKQLKPDNAGAFKNRIEEMERFYTLMMRHYESFLKEWEATK